MEPTVELGPCCTPGCDQPGTAPTDIPGKFYCANCSDRVYNEVLSLGYEFDAEMRAEEATGRKHVGPTELRDRGWTDQLIAQMLGPPDRLAHNWHKEGAPPFQLYELARVLEAEERPEFKKR